MKGRSMCQSKSLPSSALVVTLADISIVFLAGYASSLFRFGAEFSFSNLYIALIATSLAIFFITAIFSGLYQTWRGMALSTMLTRYSTACAITAALILGALVFTKSGQSISRIWLASSMLTVYLAGISFRVVYFYLIKSLRRKGYNVVPVFIAYTIGADIKKMDGAAVVDTGYFVSMRYQLDPEDTDYNFLVEALQKSNCNELWLLVAIDNANLIRDIMHALRFEPINIRLLPDFGDQVLLNTKPRQLGKNIALDLSCTPLEGKDAALKRLFDIVVSAGILFVIWPVILVIAITIKATSRGPITFKQQRNGLYGKKFWVYKFRSMKLHAENNGSVTQAKQNDSRITKVGAFIRKTSLDELPQFINVLFGDMSIVGPRPHALAHNDYYKNQVEAYMWRNKVKPGITGWAQINGFRGETDTIEKMEKRIECDLWYIENWSLWWDVKIFLKTFLSGFSDKNAY
jgi:putative colanic acid biosynthesis UDP-glucose lipid carrier transferase